MVLRGNLTGLKLTDINQSENDFPMILYFKKGTFHFSKLWVLVKDRF